MGLDITFTERENVICPHCGEVVATRDVVTEHSGGRIWYDILEDIGYYVPHDKRTEENDWYGKDMVLTTEQAERLYWYAMEHRDICEAYNVTGLVARAMLNKNAVVINADW